MDTISHRDYAIPVHTFEFPDDGEYVEPDEPESDDEDRIKVSLYESQTGPPRMTALHYVDGTRDHYNFRVTDEELQWCAYKGDDPGAVPIDVLHAVHHFGYGVENITTLGHWFTMWMEAQHSLQTVIQLLQETDDPYTAALAESTAEVLDAVVVALLLKYELSNDEYVMFWDDPNNRFADGESIHVANLKDDLWEVAEAEDSPLLGPGDGSGDELTVGLTIDEYEKRGNDLIAVDIVAPFGIERVAFEIQGEDTAVFTRREPSGRPHPMALSAVRDHGYDVLNEGSVSTSDDPLVRLERTASFLTELRDNPPDPTVEDTHPFMALTQVTRGRVGMLLQLLLARNADQSSYQTAAHKVSDHFGVTNPRQLQTSTLTEILTAILGVMPEDVHNSVRDRLISSDVFDEDDFDKGLV